MEKLLVVEDSPEIQKQIRWGLGKDYRVLLAGNRQEALAMFQANRPRVVTLDLGLPPEAAGSREGFCCLEGMLAERPATKIVVLTGNSDQESALKAVGMGAYDYYRKPIDLAELKVILKRAFHLASLEDENRRLQGAIGGSVEQMAGMFGQCREMQEVFRTVKKVSCCDVPVLILGESGTGKELVAKAVHGASLRRNGPFVPINCGAIPENLLESELFGHEKGAFTGALSRLQGKVEYAHGGTLFLDEIGELPAPLQVKLLRFLQEKVIQRVGGREDIAIDARIIAATNVDIKKAIDAGTFREDLYYRIGVLTLQLPPLREREGDVQLLANLFLRRFSDELHKKIRGFSPAALEIFARHHWPGNVRELENRIRRGVIMCESSVIGPRELGFTPDKGTVRERDRSLSLKEARDRLECEMVIAAIQKHSGNVAKAAETLGISRPTIYDLMKKHGFHVPT